ncbi:hypothetical protein, partial [Agromyces humi]|uniref:hypothetical protein n=1 Tax=Agromyces humi TaxID=1766800 RepID=UPI00193943DE
LNSKWFREIVTLSAHNQVRDGANAARADVDAARADANAARADAAAARREAREARDDLEIVNLITERFKVGDRVVYAGEVVDESWGEIARAGTIIAERKQQLIDIRWDGAGLTLGQDASGFNPGPAESARSSSDGSGEGCCHSCHC